MFDMHATAPSGGDCTAPYAVVLDKNYTLGEFIAAVISKSDEWGYIDFEHSGAVFTAPRFEYRYGRLLTPLSREIACRQVVSARAHGGYTRMDYHLTIE